MNNFLHTKITRRIFDLTKRYRNHRPGRIPGIKIAEIMKTYEVHGKNINVIHATALSNGYGHKKITVELQEEFTGETKTFSATTSNMPDFDTATDLDGQDKYEALYEIIDSSVEDEVYEWLED